MEIIPPVTYDIDSPDGVEPVFKAGDEVPITARYNAALIDGSVSTMVDITNATPAPQQNWTYDGASFSTPSSTGT